MENVTRERAYTKQGQMLTEDENIVEVPLTVQYKISNLQDFVLNVDQPEISLQQATESACATWWVPPRWIRCSPRVVN